MNMHHHYQIQSRRVEREMYDRGLTLIETMLYMVLLSLLLFGFIQFAVDINYQNIELSHDIEEAY